MSLHRCKNIFSNSKSLKQLTYSAQLGNVRVGLKQGELSLNPVKHRIANVPQANSIPRTELTILGIISAIGYASLFILLPAMPAIMAEFNKDLAEVQLIVSLSFLIMGIGSFLFGFLSERYSHRTILLYALFVFTASSLLAGFAQSMETLITARCAQAASGSAGIAVARTRVLNELTRDHAAGALAYIIVPITFLPLILPLLGGLLTQWLSWRWVFHLGGLMGLSGMIVTYLWMPKLPAASRAPKPLGTLSGIMRLLRSRRFNGYNGHHTFVVVAIQVLQTAAPFILIQSLGYSPSQYGLLVTIPALGSLAGALIAGKLTARLGGDKIIAFGAKIGVLAYSVMLFCALAGMLSPITIIGPWILIALSNTLSLPSSTSGALEEHAGLRGLGAGLMAMIQWVIAGLIVQISAFFLVDSATPVLVTTLLCYLFACAFFKIGSRAPRLSPTI